MAKAAKTTKVLSALYQDHLRDKIRWQNGLIAGPLTTVGLTFNSRENSAYTTLVGKKGTLRIVIGGGMVAKVAGLPETFSDKATLKPFLTPIIMAFYGLDLHEMGHVKFTDMVDTSITTYKEPKYIGFLHHLFNILEDPVVEESMDQLYQRDFSYEIRPKEYFDYMKEQIFMPQGEEYVDTKDQQGFLNFLLLNLRIGRKNIKHNCEIFDKYSSDLMPQIIDIEYEPNPTERIHKTIKLGEWIIENIKEFDWTMPEPDPKAKVSGRFSGSGDGAPIPSDSMAGPGSLPIGDESESDSGGAGGAKEPGSSDDSDEESDGASEDRGAEDEKPEEEEEDKEGPKRDPGDDIDPNDEGLDDIFNDVIHDGDDHEWVVAKDDYEIRNIDKINERLDQQIEQFIEPINDVSKFLKLFKGRIRPRVLEGFTSGRLNIRRAMKDDLVNGCDLKIFNRSAKRGQDKDVAVTLVTDNSGSMSGSKSEACSRAAVTLAQACEWAGIPFECHAFTKTEDSMYGTCITITEKSFEDSFESAKPYFAINDSTLIHYLQPLKPIPTFRGNSEEINLYYIWKRFARVNHKTKLLFVMCDGATTGSRSDLKDIVRRIEVEDGIIVIGIGIMCSEVASIYPHSQLFHSQEDLEKNLANYLIDTLSKYAI